MLSPVRPAADPDYRLTVPPDACADSDPETHRVLMEKVFPHQALVTEADDWIQTLRRASRSAPSIEANC